jgi:acyl-CoA thioesterase
MADGSDLAWLGLERHDEGRWSFELTPPLSRMDGKLYGGTGIATTIATLEAETGREALWTTVQFAASAELGERIDCHVEVLATGRRTSQGRVTASVGDRVVFAALGATCAQRESPIDVQVPTMPDVPGPDEGEAFAARWHPEGLQMGWLLLAEMRQVEIGENRFVTWGRMRDLPISRAAISFLADLVPSSVARAAGFVGGGTSLDNSMRIGRLPETEWVLLDFDPWIATNGYLHGGARVWAEDGTMVGFASQTATAMVWTGEAPPWLKDG